jgi:hypothetical protein
LSLPKFKSNLFYYFRTSIVQEHWTNFILTTPTPVFISAKFTGEAKQNANNIAANIDEILITLDERKLSAVITDNAPVMKLTWKILAEKYPKILFMGCLAHGLNLLACDVSKLEWAKNIIISAKSIVKYFKNHIIPNAILKKYQQATYGANYCTLKLPVKTRWGSVATCLSSLKINQLAIKLSLTEILRGSDIFIDEMIKNIIQSEDFWEQTTELLNILDEIVQGIIIFESDVPKLSQFYEWYESLENSEGIFLKFSL